MLITHLDRENLEDLAAREELDEGLLADVASIIAAVRREKDSALTRFSSDLDGWNVADPAELRVCSDALREAAERVDPALLEALILAAERIRSFHEREKLNSWFVADDGSILGQKVTPLARVGIYVPGGRASYPSTVLMNAIPARVAGVQKIIMCTPPGADGTVSDAVLAAAYIGGVDEVYKLGGAHAVAAMAYGTQTIKRVDKITGPGNIYVTLAKKLVVGQVGIDMLAGPSEVLIVADGSALPSIVAWDMLAQAEHDPLASAMLITTSDGLATAVESEVNRFLAGLRRKAIAEASLAQKGRILVCDDLQTAWDFVNLYAPEHLEVIVKDAFAYLGKIENAGAVFLGSGAAEALGDYVAGPNHTLPTSGTARFSSPLGVSDFVKRSSVISFSGPSAARLAEHGRLIAESEGLEAHAQSLTQRMIRGNTE